MTISLIALSAASLGGLLVYVAIMKMFRPEERISHPLDPAE